MPEVVVGQTVSLVLSTREFVMFQRMLNHTKDGQLFREQDDDDVEMATLARKISAQVEEAKR